MGLAMESGEAAEIMSRDRGKVRSHERLVTHEGLWFHGPPPPAFCVVLSPTATFSFFFFLEVSKF